ncbi:MAG: T9SS type A sorting domain-containing protein [FCB group bacterium]
MFNKRTILKIYFILLLNFIIYGSAAAQLSGKIYTIPDTSSSHYIDFGMCLLGDTLFSSFYLQNTGKLPLKLGGSNPSYYLGEYIPNNREWEEFHTYNQQPGTIDTGITSKLTIFYFAGKDTANNLHPIGTKHALLKMGLYDAQFSTQPDSSLFIVKDNYILIARKTKHFVDGYENVVNFDSVYVNPTAPVEWDWRVQNVFNDSIDIDSAHFRMLSNDSATNELYVKGYALPLRLYKKTSPVIWKLYYNPVDIGIDSAYYYLSYHPLINQYPDSVDYASVKMIGTGVQQILTLTESDASFSGDIIDVGQVKVGTTKTIFGILRNDGNMPFGTISQNIFDEYVDTTAKGFSITRKFLNKGNDLFPTAIDSFKISIKPVQRGNFLVRYVDSSDIIYRGILKYPPEARQKTIYIKGTGTAPEISVASDTVNFKDVVLLSDCSASKTMTIQIGNTGNANLEIMKLTFFPPFTCDTINEIDANSQKDLKVIFSSSTLGDYYDSLYIYSNAIPPQNIFKLYLIASSVQPEQISLSIPEISAKPGRKISVPILGKGSNVSITNKFSDTISYDNSILRYTGFEKNGTASESANLSDIIINETPDKSRIGISIQTPTNANFRSSDTLILLNFDTYLGDNLSTSISFANPLFYSGHCVITPIFINGEFILDSVCGLAYKIFPSTGLKFSLSDIVPNPAIEKIDIVIEVAYDTKVELKLYDSQGELSFVLIDGEMTEGKYMYSFPIYNLSPGVYYCRMRAGLYQQVRKVIISK